MKSVRVTQQNDTDAEYFPFNDAIDPSSQTKGLSASPPPTSIRRLLKTLIRSLRLTLVKTLMAKHWKTRFEEERKVEIQRNRFHAAIRCGFRVIPVTAALALVALNVSQYYVGGELTGRIGQDDEKLGALQFAAKLHEMLMIASLGTVIFSYLRRELLFGEGIPFGTLSAGLEIEKFNFLYSPELWRAMWADWERKRKKWILLTLLVTCTLLGVSVDPSATNLMRPRLGDWAAGGTSFWISTPKAAMEPQIVDWFPRLAQCLDSLDNLACPHGDWDLIERQYQSYWPALQPMGTMPETISISSQLSSKTMVVRRDLILQGVSGKMHSPLQQFSSQLLLTHCQNWADSGPTPALTIRAGRHSYSEEM